jgi:hypothetical protein
MTEGNWHTRRSNGLETTIGTDPSSSISQNRWVSCPCPGGLNENACCAIDPQKFPRLPPEDFLEMSLCLCFSSKSQMRTRGANGVGALSSGRSNSHENSAESRKGRLEKGGMRDLVLSISFCCLHMPLESRSPSRFLFKLVSVDRRISDQINKRSNTTTIQMLILYLVLMSVSTVAAIKVEYQHHYH